MKESLRNHLTHMSWTMFISGLLMLGFLGRYAWAETSLAPTADTYVRVNDATVHGAETRVLSKNGADYMRHGYFKFDTSSVQGNFQSAILRFTLNNTWPGTGSAVLYEFTNNAWNESINWSSRPSDSAIGAVLSTIPLPVAEGGLWEVDVTNYLNARRALGIELVSFTLRTPTHNNSGIGVWSRESLTPPELVLTVSGPPQNQPPIVNAGIDQTTQLPDDTVDLTGIVTDDGLPNPPGALSIAWSKVSGPGEVIFSNPSSLTTTASFSAAGDYVLRLTAGDSELQTSDDILITVNPPPSGGSTFTDNFNRASIGPNWSVVSGIWQINVDKLKHQSTSGGKIVLNIPLDSNDYEAEASFQFTTLTSGNHRGIILRYQNSSNYYYGQYHRENRKYRIIKVQNGVWTTLAEVPASGVSSNTYHMIKMRAEGASLKLYFDGVLKVETQDSTFTTGTVGIYSQSYYHHFDDFVLTTLTPIPQNQPPVVNAGADASVTLPDTLNLSGVVSDDGLPNPPGALTIAWSKVSGPGDVSFSNPSSLTTTASFSVAGDYVLRLTAGDSELQTSDDILITVSPLPDTTPPDGSVLIDGGAATTADLTVTLTLTASDSGSGLDQVQYSPDAGGTWTSWESFSATRDITLPSGDGTKEVRYQIRDLAGNTATYSDTIILQTPPPGGSTFTDNFNRASIGPNWSVVTGIWQMNVNKLKHQSTSGGKIVLNIPLDSNDYEAEASFQFTTLTSGNHRGIITRYQNSSNYYYGQYHRENRKYRIIKVQNGVWTTLAEVPASGVSSNTYHAIKMRVEGTNLKLYFDGVLKVETQDSTFAQGKPGIYSQNNYHHFDDFSLTTLVSTPPFVTVDPISSPTNQTQITLTGTKAQNTSVRSNGSEIVPLDSSGTWSAPQIELAEEGENAFSISARYSSGTESQPVEVNVARDTEPPVIEFTDPASGSFVNQPQMLVSGTIDGELFTMWAELSEGPNVLTKTDVDEAGNQGQESITLILDTVPPSITVNSPPHNAWVTNAQLTVQFTCDDLEDSEMVQLAEQGINQLTVSCTDLAGNVGSVTHIVRLDTIPPEIVFTSHGDGERVASTEELIVYTVDGVEHSAVMSLPTDGPHIFTVNETDAAGNQSSETLTIVRDTTAPGFTVIFPEDGGFINRSQVVMP